MYSYKVTLDFISKMNLVSTRSSMRKFLNEKVVSDDEETLDHFIKLDDEVNNKRFKFITKEQDLLTTKLTVINIFRWIAVNGKTDRDCNLKIEIKGDTIKDIDKFRFVLNFDEDKIFEALPNRKGYYECYTIKTLTPANLNILLNPEYKENFKVPSDFFYGVDLRDIKGGEIRYNYFGGYKYHTKKQEFLDYINYIHENLENQKFPHKLSTTEKAEFERLIEKTSIMMSKFYSADAFFEGFKKVRITVDMKDNKTHVKTFWHTMRYKLFELLMNNRLYGEYNINIDTSGYYEIFGCEKVFGSQLDEFAFIDCGIKGVMTNSVLSNCIIKKSSVVDCDLKTCDIENTEIFESNVDGCDMTKVMINNNNTDRIVSGNLKSGVLINSRYDRELFTIGEDMELMDEIKTPYNKDGVFLKNVIPTGYEPKA